MKPACIRHTELPHTTKLFADLVYHFDQVSRFYPHNPADQEAYTAAAKQIQFPEERRAALTAALRDQNGPSAELNLLAQAGTCVVTTGQQVGLFSGPCYTIYKALTAAKLARHLTARGIPAVPVFWLATEDHDFAEVNHCWTFEEGHRPVSLRINGSSSSQRPVGGVPLNSVPVEQLRASLNSFPFGEEVASMVAETYVPGKSLGAAFRDLLKRLLPRYGLLHLDPMEPAVRALAAPVIRKAVEAAPELTESLLARNGELQAAGYHVQVHVEPKTSLFFLLAEGRRVALRRRDREYLTNQGQLSTAELAAHAETITPNALLRPVVQDYILPTVAYVGGAAEMAYLAQSQVLYQALLGRMPVPFPRSAFTVLDARSAKLLDRYGLTLQSCLHGLDALRDQIARKLFPQELGESFQAANGKVTREIDELRDKLSIFDGTLVAALEKSRAKILYQLSKVEGKVARAALRRNARWAEEAAYLYGLIYPNKHLQERFYTILPFLAKHGLDLVDRLYENVHLDCPDHILFVA